MFNSRNCTIAINEIRENFLISKFTKDCILNAFKNSGIPSNELFWIEFSKSNILTKVNKDIYRFSKPFEPIYINDFTRIYLSYKEKRDRYQNKWRDGKKKRKLMKSEEIQNAIKLLNNLGYEIVKKINLNNLT